MNPAGPDGTKPSSFLGLALKENGAGPACEAGPSAGNDEEAACEAASPVEQSAPTAK